MTDMHLFASIFDPSDNGFDITDAAAILSFVLLVIGTIVGVLKWTSKVLRKIVREEIAVATLPIQPTANGGLSLPDVAKATHTNRELLLMIAQATGVDVSSFGQEG